MYFSSLEWNESGKYTVMLVKLKSKHYLLLGFFFFFFFFFFSNTDQMVVFPSLKFHWHFEVMTVIGRYMYMNSNGSNVHLWCII